MYISEYVEGKEFYAMIYIQVTDELKSKVGSKLENFGYIRINPTSTKKEFKEVFYDGLQFFYENKIKDIVIECEEDFYDKKLLKEIKKFLLKMVKKGYLK